MTSDPKEPQSSDLVLDASALINILGCGKPSHLLRCLGRVCVVEERVLGELKRHPVSALNAKAEVDALVQQGLIRLVRMTDDEYDVYLQFAAASGVPGLGAGESAALAVASSPGACHAVVLDDRKARHRTATRLPSLRVVSSVMLFLEAAANASLDHAEVRSLFVAARDKASMCVLKEDHPLVAHLRLDEA